MRFCTQELKIRPMRDYMRARGFENWSNAVGIRADEPRRVARMREANERGKERWDVILPLAEAGITLADVTAYWEGSPFDLQLRPHEGNCDLCFLKGLNKRRQIVRDNPELAEWWIEQERRIGKPFRIDTPSYAAIRAQGDLFVGLEPLDGDLIDCTCTD